MSTAIAGATCPMPPTKTTATVSTDKGEGAFRRIEKPKEDVKTWWEHEIRVEVSFCKEKSEDWMRQTAKEFTGKLDCRSGYYSSRNQYRFEQINRPNDQTMEIVISARGKELSPAEVKKDLEARVPMFLGNWMTHHPVNTAKFDFTSEKKEEITRYTVQDGYEKII